MIVLDVRPSEGVYFAFPHTGIIGQKKEYIETPGAEVVFLLVFLFRFFDEFLELVGGIVSYPDLYCFLVRVSEAGYSFDWVCLEQSRQALN